MTIYIQQTNTHAQFSDTVHAVSRKMSFLTCALTFWASSAAEMTEDPNVLDRYFIFEGCIGDTDEQGWEIMYKYFVAELYLSVHFSDRFLLYSLHFNTNLYFQLLL